jgi:hypothetical protein
MGLPSLKCPEHVSLLLADHRLACSANLVIRGHLQGSSLVNLRNTLITPSESEIELFFVFLVWFYPLGDL